MQSAHEPAEWNVTLGLQLSKRQGNIVLKSEALESAGCQASHHHCPAV